MLTILELVVRTTAYFEKHGIENPRLNAELIIAHALKTTRMKLYLDFERPLSEAEVAPIRDLVRRRARREPLAYVLGEAAFLDFTLRVDPRVLIPRPETEQLVELIRDSIAAEEAPEDVIDLGTGSGALAIALAAAYPQSRVTACDVDAAAIQLATENAVAAGIAEGRVRFVESDWFSAISGEARFDLVVSNPPYLAESEWASAEPEVRDHEPRHALVAEDDGCGCLLAIIRQAPAYMRPGGWLFLETGIDQHARLLPAMQEAGFVDPKSGQDWSGRDRFVYGRIPAAG